jgi:transposase
MDDKLLFAKILGLRAPWFIKKVVVDDKAQRVDIYVDHEPDIRVRCPVCDTFYGLYDHAPERVYRHLNTCQMQTYIHVRPPRVNCPTHGVKQIGSEFGENGSELSFHLERFVIRVAQECSIEATARLCGLSWDQSWGVLERAVNRGQARKERRVPVHLGVDEKSIAKGHRYESLVYDIDAGTVEFVWDERGRESLESYFRQFLRKELEEVKAVAMDMWEPYIAATKKHVPEAEKKIVFDRFHVMRHILDAVDEVRKSENRSLLEAGESPLKGTKYLWLWSQENVPERRQEEFAALRALDLKVCRAWAIKENLRRMWDYRYATPMRKFFKRWYFWATHSRLTPMIKAAKTLKAHIDNIVTYARHRITNALGEAINAKIERVKRMACGYRNRKNYRTAIYFHCGGLDLFPRPPAQPTLCYSSVASQYVGGTH